MELALFCLNLQAHTSVIQLNCQEVHCIYKAFSRKSAGSKNLGRLRKWTSCTFTHKKERDFLLTFVAVVKQEQWRSFFLLSCPQARSTRSFWIEIGFVSCKQQSYQRPNSTFKKILFFLNGIPSSKNVSWMHLKFESGPTLRPFQLLTPQTHCAFCESEISLLFQYPIGLNKSHTNLLLHATNPLKVLKHMAGKKVGRTVILFLIQVGLFLSYPVTCQAINISSYSLHIFMFRDVRADYTCPCMLMTR